MFDSRFWRNYFKAYDVLNKIIPYQELMIISEKELNLKLDDIVLDVGSGTGNFMMRIKNKCKKIIGIDFSKEGIKIHKLKDSNAETILTDITEKFPFPDNYFSKIISINTIYTLDKEKQLFTLSEIYRVLSVGGKFVLVNVIKNFRPFKIYKESISKNIKKDGFFRTIFLVIILLKITFKMFYYNSIIKKSGLTKKYNFLSEKEQKEILEKIGFSKISETKYSYAGQAIIKSAYKI